MHVTIDRTEITVGWINKKTRYVVKATVTFSEEEKAIIKKAKLMDKWAIFWPSADGQGDYGVDFKKVIQQPISRGFDYVSDANAWEKELKTLRIPAIKNIIDQERGSGTSSTSFEV